MASASIKELVRDMDLEARLRLVQDLWDLIVESVEQAPLSTAERELLDDRIAKYEANPADTVSWPDVRAKLLARR